MYRLPTEGEYGIKVAPPTFGEERITVYAATVPLNEIADIVPTGAGTSDTPKSTSPKRGGAKIIEFVEVSTTLTTKRND